MGTHFLIQGERGIGKSSLLLLAKYAAAGSITTRQPFKFVVIDVEIGTSTSYPELFRQIGFKLKSELAQRHDLRTLMGNAFDFLTSWHVLGVEYKNPPTAQDHLDELEYFARTCTYCVNDSQGSLDGILLLIDEADKADPSTLNLGEMIKLLTNEWLNCSAKDCASAFPASPP